MEKKADLRHKTQETVYACPFCKGSVWFNRNVELANHLYKEHLRQSLYYIADSSYAKVIEKFKKWLVDE